MTAKDERNGMGILEGLTARLDVISETVEEILDEIKDRPSYSNGNHSYDWGLDEGD